MSEQKLKSVTVQLEGKSYRMPGFHRYVLSFEDESGLKGTLSVGAGNPDIYVNISESPAGEMKFAFQMQDIVLQIGEMIANRRTLYRVFVPASDSHSQSLYETFNPLNAYSLAGHFQGSVHRAIIFDPEYRLLWNVPCDDKMKPVKHPFLRV